MKAESKKRLPTHAARASAIVLDLDGPILDVRDRHYACYARIVRELGAQALPAAAYWNLKRAGRTPRDVFARSADQERYPEFARRWLDLIESPEALTLDRVHQGAKQWLEASRSAGHELVLATLRQNSHALEEQLDRLDLTRFFDAVVACSPSAGAEGKAARATQAAHHPVTLWIGDTELDARAASIAGCRCALVTSGLRDENYLRALNAGPVISSLSELKIDDSPLLRRES